MPSFFDLKRNSARLGMAVNCALFFSALSQEGLGGDESYKLLVRVFQVLNSVREAGDLFPLLFRARLAHEQGYFPRSNQCVHCGTDLAAEQKFFFWPQDGRLYCPACSHFQGLSFSSLVLPFLQGLFLRDPTY